MRGASATGNLVQNDDSTVPRPVKHGHSQAALQGSPPGQGPGIVTTASLGAHSSEDRDSWEHLRRPTRLPLSGAPHPDNKQRQGHRLYSKPGVHHLQVPLYPKNTQAQLSTPFKSTSSKTRGNYLQAKLSPTPRPAYSLSSRLPKRCPVLRK